MNKEFLIEILSIVSISHVWQATLWAVKVFHSLLGDDKSEMLFEALYTEDISAARHYDSLRGEQLVIIIYTDKYRILHRQLQIFQNKSGIPL